MMPASPQSAVPEQEDDSYLDLADLRKQVDDYFFTKQAEIDEKKQSRHYFHGDQWTSAELATLKKRHQPKVTKNRIKRKINGIVGLIQRLRRDPKAYPRTPQHEHGAELATAVIRYVLENNRWEPLSSKCAGDAAREGFGGLEIGLEDRPEGDQDLTLTRVHTDTFFYDPRSFEPDFSDARYLGVAKWVDVDVAKEMFPDKEKELDGLMEGSSTLSSDTDRESKWINTNRKRVRLVDHWYQHGGQWCWCAYAAGVKLMEGHSPFVDEQDKSFPKYIMFSAEVDHDGDRYGFVRDLKDTQDEINHRYSKALHYLNTRRMIIRKGTQNVEDVRKEAARPDGVIEWETEAPVFDDATKQADMDGQLKFLEDGKNEIENFGPNPALIGQGIENKSGRAIALLQQAGVAELGPFFEDFTDWKLRVYRACWFIVRKFWTAERWIRVTDNQEVEQLLHINGIQFDPQRGPVFVNAIGSIDVDIIVDEGSDTINTMADAYDTLSVLAAKGAQVPPGLLVEISPLESSVKKKWLDKMEQQAQAPPPEIIAAQHKQQIEAQSAQSRIQLEQQKAAAEAQQKREQAASDMQLERERNAMQIQVEREKNMMEIQLEREKGLLQLQLKAQAQEYELQFRERAAAQEAPRQEAERQSRQQTEGGMATVVAHLGTLIAETQKQTREALTAPKKLVRDGQGRPSGVETVL